MKLTELETSAWSDWRAIRVSWRKLTEIRNTVAELRSLSETGELQGRGHEDQAGGGEQGKDKDIL